MPRRTLCLLACLVILVAGCGSGSVTVPTNVSGPEPTGDGTQEPSAEATATRLVQHGATPAAQVPSATEITAGESGTLCLVAFVDQDGDMQQDDVEALLPEVRFVVRNDLVEFESVLHTTDSEGNCLTQLPSGEYSVAADLPMGFINTSPALTQVTVPPGETVHVAAGFVRTNRPDGKLEVEGVTSTMPILASDFSGFALYLAGEETLYKSTDGGENWQMVGEMPPASTIVVSQAEPSILYAGGATTCFQGGPPLPLYVSHNAGVEWTESPGGMGLRPAASDSADSAVAWAIGCDGPYVTEDTGLTWQLLPSEFWGLYLLDAIHPVRNHPQLLYAAGNSEGGSGAVFSSEDKGLTWKLVTDEPELWIEDLLVQPDDGNELWFLTPTGVWHSADGGDSWSASSGGLDDVAVGDEYHFEGKGLHALARTELGTLFLGTEKGVFQSDNQGVSWQRLAGAPWEAEPITELHSSSVWPIPRLWVSSRSGIYLVTPGGQ